MMINDNIIYFEKEGNINFPNVIKAVADYIKKDNSVKNIVVFAGNLHSVFALKDSLEPFNVTLTVATYANGRKFRKRNDDENKFITPEVASFEAKEKILESGMNYIQGGLPFEPILSCTGDNATVQCAIDKLNEILGD